MIKLMTLHKYACIINFVDIRCSFYGKKMENIHATSLHLLAKKYLIKIVSSKQG